VREDAQIPSADRLTLAALEDHFPEMLDELNSVLAHPQVKADAGEIRQTGGEHGKARWRSGYRLDEVLRELARMREILLAEAARFAADDPSAATQDEAARTIRHFFDTIVATSARLKVCREPRIQAASARRSDFVCSAKTRKFAASFP